ncbi:hypothetical protein [Winogradskyella aurantiaca]|uniref:hypothetical protein n=1 Tax=Winogradskyella aurantiaca TaxID=2219558 RepID=UPI001E441772|nr:hypothetical protein [Winogradskyella aurantiaca]
MTMNFRPLITLIAAALLMAACNTKESIDPFLVGNHSVGLLNDSTQIKDLKGIFANDSIATFENDMSFIGSVSDIRVYDTLGEHLLTLSPTEAQDSTATISTIRIETERYQTAEGINLNSTYGDLTAAYEVKKIDNLINTIVVSVKGSDAAFTIDKKELPANMRFDMNLNIDPIQIPDQAKIKYFMIHW